MPKKKALEHRLRSDKRKVMVHPPPAGAGGSALPAQCQAEMSELLWVPKAVQTY